MSGRPKRNVKKPVKYEEEFAEPARNRTRAPARPATTPAPAAPTRSTTGRAAPKKAAPKKAAPKKAAPKKTTTKKTASKKPAASGSRKKPAASKGKKRARDDDDEEDEVPDEDADVDAEGDGESSPKRAKTGDEGGEEEVADDGPAEGGEEGVPDVGEDEVLPDADDEAPKDEATAPKTPAPGTTHDPRLEPSSGFSRPDMEGTPTDLTTTNPRPTPPNPTHPGTTSPTYPNRGSPTRPTTTPSSDPLESPKYERDPDHTEIVGRPFGAGGPSSPDKSPTGSAKSPTGTVKSPTGTAKSPTGAAKSPTGSAKSPTGSSPAVPPRSGDRVGERTRSGPAAARAGRDVGYDDFGDSILGPAGSSTPSGLFAPRSTSGPPTSGIIESRARARLADPYIGTWERERLIGLFPHLAPSAPSASLSDIPTGLTFGTTPADFVTDPEGFAAEVERGFACYAEYTASLTATADASRTSLFGESVRERTGDEGTSGLPEGPSELDAFDSTVAGDESRTSLFGESPRARIPFANIGTGGRAPGPSPFHPRHNEDGDDSTMEPDTSAFVPSPGPTFVDQTTDETGDDQVAANHDSTADPDGATELPEDDTAEDVTSTSFLVGAIEREIDQATMFEAGDGTSGTTPGRTSTAPATTARTPTAHSPTTRTPTARTPPARTPTARSPTVRSPTARRPSGRRPSARRPSPRSPTTPRPRSPLAGPPMTHETLANTTTTDTPTTNAALGDDGDEEDVDSTSFIVGRIENTIAQGDFGDDEADQAPAPPAPPVTPPRPIVRDRDGEVYSGSPTDSQYELMEPGLDAIYDESTPPRRREPPPPPAEPTAPPVVQPTVQPATRPAVEEATDTYSPTVESSQDEAEVPETPAQVYRRPGIRRAPSSTQPARDVGPPSASGLAHDESETRDGPRDGPGEVRRPIGRAAATAFTSLLGELGVTPDGGEVAGPPPTYPSPAAPPAAGHGRSLAEELEANRALLSGLGGAGDGDEEEETEVRGESEEPEEPPADPSHQPPPEDDDDDDDGSLFNDTQEEINEMGLAGGTPKLSKFFKK
ncbi:hypothetical protein PRZ48_008814 [Zasmidium cellare]|uniref:Uncharacterized protein n=1 Tax=Zasmidium cellare TaxID=395010 RepID=A0ABR0EHJ9_ZASCE|nr:hypothetical protein PRZ48_008814 [Zasmidium cellare]